MPAGTRTITASRRSESTRTTTPSVKAPPAPVPAGRGGRCPPARRPRPAAPAWLRQAQRSTSTARQTALRAHCRTGGPHSPFPRTPFPSLRSLGRCAPPESPKKRRAPRAHRQQAGDPRHAWLRGVPRKPAAQRPRRGLTSQAHRLTTSSSASAPATVTTSTTQRAVTPHPARAARPNSPTRRARTSPPDDFRSIKPPPMTGLSSPDIHDLHACPQVPTEGEAYCRSPGRPWPCKNVHGVFGGGTSLPPFRMSSYRALADIRTDIRRQHARDIGRTPSAH
jgi:hypothetical protein